MPEHKAQNICKVKVRYWNDFWHAIHEAHCEHRNKHRRLISQLTKRRSNFFYSFIQLTTFISKNCVFGSKSKLVGRSCSTLDSVKSFKLCVKPIKRFETVFKWTKSWNVCSKFGNFNFMWTKFSRWWHDTTTAAVTGWSCCHNLKNCASFLKTKKLS